MLIRLIMTIFLLIVSTTPTWANTNEKAISDSVKYQMSEGYILEEQDVLSSINIQAEDWLDGDTYYIRYTFTNPTNTPLEKKIDLITVTYDLCHAADPYQTITQYTEAIPQLQIQPYSSCTETIELKQPIPVQFNKLTSCTIFFADNSSLQYNALGDSAPISPFRLIPVVSPFGDVSLTIQNRSATEAITELRDIRLNFTIGQEPYKLLKAEPISLEIKPSESYSLPLFTLPSANNTKSSSAFTLNTQTANAANTSSNNSYHINMKINGIPHTYFDNPAKATRIQGAAQNTFIDTSDTHYQFAPKKLNPQDGAFYLDESYLYGYVKVKNNSNTAVTSSQITYRLTLPYFDHSSHYQEQQFTVRLPQDFNLAANKSIYYSFKIPLPADFSKLHARNGIALQSTNRSLAHAKLAQVSDISAITKKQYTLLTDVTIENQ